ncbi:glycoside hydrolase family 25 protein [Chelatococcus sambhunathii]|uniref:Glycoside hydrolase family 25 protein n=1 Tax=Chelatococcus sambhunathii TaxID=363953 RepID=A0ABU1DK53_9HYPH|nr:glycoside hydrolase family 25 protein [Chelatococcus sambhunathii]MDR4308398.1 glycoside hydrolase family 25 protein [Chelatococcus sambhunathii]
MFNGVIDVSHHNRIEDFARLRRAGIVAVIHKATEGATFRDPLYRERREAARAAGLRFGSYHFSSGVSVEAQVENYLAHADPRDDELVCLDWEESFSGRDMPLAEAEEFVTLIEARLGRPPVIYGGRHLRERLVGVERSALSRCPLWYARFAPEPKGVPPLWDRWTFWQYTDGASGPEPHEVAGIGPCDRDLFNGTEAEFYARWPF